MNPAEWAEALFKLEYEFVSGKEFDDLTTDQKTELIFELADDDERTTFNSADLSSGDYSSLYDLIFERIEKESRGTIEQ